MQQISGLQIDTLTPFHCLPITDQHAYTLDQSGRSALTISCPDIVREPTRETTSHATRQGTLLLTMPRGLILCLKAVNNYRFKSDIGKTSESLGGAHTGFSERTDTILNWAEQTVFKFQQSNLLRCLDHRSKVALKACTRPKQHSFTHLCRKGYHASCP